MRVVIVAFSGLTAACWTWPDVVQPGIEFRVASVDGTPIKDATITLARHSVSMTQSERTATFATDASGVATIPGERQWLFHVALPDMGGQIYSWSWCVEADGFMPDFRNDLRSSGYDSVEEVTLAPSDSLEACVWQCYPCAFASVAE